MQPDARVNKGSRPQSKREELLQQRRIQRIKNARLEMGTPKPAPKGAFSDREVTIIVRGAATKPIKPIKILPKFLFNHSPYFRRLLRRPRDGECKTHLHRDLSLDGDAMEHFAVYCVRDTINDFHTTATDEVADVLPEMLDLYLLAEKLRETPLMNLAITKAAALAVRKGGFMLREEVVQGIYAKFPLGHKLRDFIVHQYAWAHDSMDPRFLTRNMARSMPFDFLYDFAQAQSLKLGNRKVRHQDPNLDPQRYHYEVVYDVDDDDEEEGDDHDNDDDNDAISVVDVDE